MTGFGCGCGCVRDGGALVALPSPSSLPWIAKPLSSCHCLSRVSLSSAFSFSERFSNGSLVVLVSANAQLAAGVTTYTFRLVSGLRLYALWLCCGARGLRRWQGTVCVGSESGEKLEMSAFLARERCGHLNLIESAAPQKSPQLQLFAEIVSKPVPFVVATEQLCSLVSASGSYA